MCFSSSPCFLSVFFFLIFDAAPTFATLRAALLHHVCSLAPLALSARLGTGFFSFLACLCPVFSSSALPCVTTVPYRILVLLMLDRLTVVAAAACFHVRSRREAMCKANED
jgi:hypothetical protein